MDLDTAIEKAVESLMRDVGHFDMLSDLEEASALISPDIAELGKRIATQLGDKDLAEFMVPAFHRVEEFSDLIRTGDYPSLVLAQFESAALMIEDQIDACIEHVQRRRIEENEGDFLRDMKEAS